MPGFSPLANPSLQKSPEPRSGQSEKTEHLTFLFIPRQYCGASAQLPKIGSFQSQFNAYRMSLSALLDQNGDNLMTRRPPSLEAPALETS